MCLWTGIVFFKRDHLEPVTKQREFYDDTTPAHGVTSPASLDRLTQPGRNFAINVIWDI